MKKKKYAIRPAAITILAVIIGIGARFFGFSFFDVMELKTIDFRFLSRGQLQPGPEIVLATVDEKSIAKEGKWVWPRSKIAELTRKLDAAGARVIVFDIGFLEPDLSSLWMHSTLERILENVQERIGEDDQLMEDLEKMVQSVDYDRQLAQAIRDSKAAVVLGYFFQMNREDGILLNESEIGQHQQNITTSRYAYEQYTSKEAQQVPFNRAYYPQSNIPIVASAAQYSGYFNMFSDRDGSVRSIAAIIEFNEALYAPLALMTVSAYLNAPLSVTVAEYGVDSVSIGDLPVPVDEFGEFLINYRGYEKTFPHFSITDILHDDVPREQLKDKIVLVGATAVGIFDLRVTPFSNVFPGLEIHANIVDNLLAGDYLYQSAWIIALVDMLAILVSGLILGIALPRTGAISGSLIALTLFVGYIFFAQYLFSVYGLIVNMVYPLAVMGIIYIGITLYRYIVESSQKRFIRNAFSTYLAPSVVEYIIDRPEKLVLGGEERLITAFFSDVQGFTGIAEMLSPSELVELLNEFLTDMADIIFAKKGTVDKFEGDAIIAFFGAPNEMESQAHSACLAAIEMQKRLEEMRNVWKEKGKPQLRMRIGLCTGLAVVGNMGSKNRMDYTMMGDTVNTAARLENVNKVYGTYTLVGEQTRKEAGEDLAAREIDTIQVFGKAESIRIYELIGIASEIDDTKTHLLDQYARGLAAYRNRDWDTAIDAFEYGLTLQPQDGPCRVMVQRCQTYKVQPPDPDWNGTYIMVSK